jgi:hypothetical protein
LTNTQRALIRFILSYVAILIGLVIFSLFLGVQLSGYMLSPMLAAVYGYNHLASLVARKPSGEEETQFIFYGIGFLLLWNIFFIYIAVVDDGVMDWFAYGVTVTLQMVLDIIGLLVGIFIATKSKHIRQLST